MIFFLCLCFSVNGTIFAEETSTVHYYRQLVYNHVSPFYPIRGIYEITSAIAEKSPHYLFKMDNQNRIAEIINHNPELWKQHELTHLRIYRTVFTYTGNKEIRTFFDQAGQRVPNIRGVYKEIYTYDATGFKCGLDFYDLAEKPMLSDWQISRYTWEKHNDLVVEKRYDLNGKPVSLSPYFLFVITGIKYNDKGYSMACYNLNDALEITANESGIASYQDQYDNLGNHIEYGYYDKNNKLITGPFGYAIGKKYYDDYGDVIKEEFLNIDRVCVRRINYHYDANGLVTGAE